jgi:hypothetical protein
MDPKIQVSSMGHHKDFHLSPQIQVISILIPEYLNTGLTAEVLWDTAAQQPPDIWFGKKVQKQDQRADSA